MCPAFTHKDAHLLEQYLSHIWLAGSVPRLRRVLGRSLALATTAFLWMHNHCTGLCSTTEIVSAVQRPVNIHLYPALLKLLYGRQQ